MSRSKPRLVAFKVEEDLANLLDRLPNKSAFIRRAVLIELGGTCPLCQGSGVVPKGVGQHFAQVIEAHRSVPCELCGEMHPIPFSAAEVDKSEQPWWQQFWQGGPFYCQPCYEKVTACGACGWHIESGRMEEQRCTHRVTVPRESVSDWPRCSCSGPSSGVS